MFLYSFPEEFCLFIIGFCLDFWVCDMLKVLIQNKSMSYELLLGTKTSFCSGSEKL